MWLVDVEDTDEGSGARVQDPDYLKNVILASVLASSPRVGISYVGPEQFSGER